MGELVSVILTVGGVRLGIEALADLIADPVKTRFGGFVRPPGPEDAGVPCLRLVPDEGIPHRIAGPEVRLTPTPDGWWLLAGADGVAGEFHPALGGTARLSAAGLRRDGQRTNLVENTIRALVARMSFATGWSIVHGAGLVDHSGRGHLLFGPSGAGKTTASFLALSRGARVLSDDLVAVGPEPGQVLISSTPFFGEMADKLRVERRPDVVSLADAWMLEKAAGHALRDEAASVVAAALVAATPVRDHGAALAFHAGWIERVRHGVLAFRKDAGFWDLLDS